MFTVTGKSICTGIAIGTIQVYTHKHEMVLRCSIRDTEHELQRFFCACKTAAQQLSELYTLALADMEEKDASIFAIHSALLSDCDYVCAVEKIIKEKKINAEAAVADAGKQYSEMLEGLSDEYMRQRAVDMQDITRRVLSALKGASYPIIGNGKPAIIFTENLSPSELILLDRRCILGFATESGSETSHTAVLAKHLAMPAIIGARGILNDGLNETLAVIDGIAGRVYINPNDDDLEYFRKKAQGFAYLI